jgi:hypothetical protein
MVSEFFIEGIKGALAKGESLQDAKQSFLNAGYDLNEIEEASRNLQSPANFSRGPQTAFSKGPQTTVTPRTTPLPVVQKINNQQIKQFPKFAPQVSNYSSESKDPGKILIITLIISILLLVFSLIGTLMFKNQLINLLNKLF